MDYELLAKWDAHPSCEMLVFYVEDHPADRNCLPLIGCGGSPVPWYFAESPLFLQKKPYSRFSWLKSQYVVRSQNPNILFKNIQKKTMCFIVSTPVCLNQTTHHVCLIFVYNHLHLFVKYPKKVAKHFLLSPSNQNLKNIQKHHHHHHHHHHHRSVPVRISQQRPKAVESSARNCKGELGHLLSKRLQRPTVKDDIRRVTAVGNRGWNLGTQLQSTKWIYIYIYSCI